jgi:hypothetical protein
MIKTALIRLNQPLLISFNLYDQICQYNTKTFIEPIRQKPVQYGYFQLLARGLLYWPEAQPKHNTADRGTITRPI